MGMRRRCSPLANYSERLLSLSGRVNVDERCRREIATIGLHAKNCHRCLRPGLDVPDSDRVMVCNLREKHSPNRKGRFASSAE